MSKLTQKLEKISDRLDFNQSQMKNLRVSVGLELVLFIFSLMGLVKIISLPKDFSPNLFLVFSTLCIFFVLGFHYIFNNNRILTFKEKLYLLHYTFTTKSDYNKITKELNAYIEARELKHSYTPISFFTITSLTDKSISLSDWVSNYVRKETSVINYFMTRFGNPKVEDMNFINLLTWTQLIPIKKFDINDFRMVLAINPDVSRSVLEANNLPPLTQLDLQNIFRNYSSQDLLILLTGEFFIENYLNVIKRSYALSLSLPVEKSLRTLIEYLNLMETKDFKLSDWHNKITSSKEFSSIEPITTKESLYFYKGYFKNCIASYNEELSNGEGMLFVAYEQGHPHIVFYVDQDFNLGDATYRFNQPVSVQDRQKLERICSRICLV